MDFAVTFLEGIIAFISPCVLPMLPVYITYLTGGRGENEKENKKPSLSRAFGFVLGLTAVFCLLGIFAGAVGAFLNKYQKWVNIASGAVVVFFGLSYLGVFRLDFLKGMKKKTAVNSFFTAFLFGAVYAVSLSPCTGVFLGSALMLAASSGTALRGGLLLLVYSLGMGVPFLLSALLIDTLKGVFTAIKKRYNIINKVCGVFLIIVGVLMACGVFTRLMHLLTF